jgi:transposase-like protein
MALRVMLMAEIRLEVLLEAARSGETVTEVCRRHEISRKTYYRYLRRYQAEGVDGLEPRSRAPLAQPARMASEIELEICRLRKDHPRWGARRIRAEPRRRGKPAPAAVSSINQALVRNHLVSLKPARPKPAIIRFERECPNDLWHSSRGSSAAWTARFAQANEPHRRSSPRAESARRSAPREELFSTERRRWSTRGFEAAHDRGALRDPPVVPVRA